MSTNEDREECQAHPLCQGAGLNRDKKEVVMNPALADPLWFRAMVEFHWTIRDIKRAFDVPSVVAESIQLAWPTFRECKRISAESAALREQVGH